MGWRMGLGAVFLPISRDDGSDSVAFREPAGRNDLLVGQPKPEAWLAELEEKLQAGWFDKSVVKDQPMYVALHLSGTS